MPWPRLVFGLLLSSVPRPARNTVQISLNNPLLGSSSLLGGVAAELLLGLGLDGTLGLQNGGGTGDGGLAEVGAVASLSDVVGDVFVGPRGRTG